MIGLVELITVLNAKQDCDFSFEQDWDLSDEEEPPIHTNIENLKCMEITTLKQTKKKNAFLEVEENPKHWLAGKLSVLRSSKENVLKSLNYKKYQEIYPTTDISTMQTAVQPLEK